MTAARKRRPPKSPPRKLAWLPSAYLAASVQRSDARELYLHVAGGQEVWLALALEGPADGDPLTKLGDHGHHLVGEFANPAAAQRAAEGFARRWLRGAKIDACPCTELDAERAHRARPGRGRRRR